MIICQRGQDGTGGAGRVLQVDDFYRLSSCGGREVAGAGGGEAYLRHSQPPIMRGMRGD